MSTTVESRRNQVSNRMGKRMVTPSLQLLGPRVAGVAVSPQADGLRRGATVLVAAEEKDLAAVRKARIGTVGVALAQEIAKAVAPALARVTHRGRAPGGR